MADVPAGANLGAGDVVRRGRRGKDAPCPRQRFSLDDCSAFTSSRSRSGCSPTGVGPWTLFDAITRSGPWMLLSGMVATGVGLAVVLGHQVWSGGVLPVVVTLVGWAALLKGIVLLRWFRPSV